MSDLTGKRIVVTRAAHQAETFCDLLRERGAEPLLYPCIAIEPPEDFQPLDRALREAAAGQYDWLVLTSANTALVLSERLGETGLTLKDIPGLRVATIGPATAEEAQKLLGLRVDVLPDEYIAEALVEAIRPEAGARILLPRAEVARPNLIKRLSAAGAQVKVVVAYQTIIGQGGIDLPALLMDGRIDAVTLTSSSTARNFVVRLVQDGGRLAGLQGVCIACIGPITADTARKVGLTVGVVAEDYTLGGLIEALEKFWINSK